MISTNSIRPSDKLAHVETYYFAKKLKEIAQLNLLGHDIINLGIGSPDLPPHDNVVIALKKGLTNPKAHQYQSYYGIPQLRSEFADFYDRHFNVTINPETEVLPLMGSKEGIMHIAMSFLNQGDEALIPNPGYPAYRMTTLLAGGVPVTYDLTEQSDWFPDFKAIEKKDLTKVKIMWVNYPNMPTGKKANLSLFESLIEFGLKHDILICHDNPYAFILNEKPLSILSVPGAKNTALELTSMSKCFNMAGWRIGAVLGAAEHIDNVVKFKSNMDSGMFMPLQIAAVEALKLGKDWFQELNETYRSRRIIAFKIFDVLNVEYKTESAGLFVWGKVPSSTSGFWSDIILKEAKVFITPGFIFGTNGDSYIRISLCSKVELLDKALQRIENVKFKLI